MHKPAANNFQNTKSALQQAHEEAKKRNLRVKAVLVANPSNPLGTTMSRNELNLLIDFIEVNKDMHLINDEIYSGTVFSSPSFISIMEILKERNYLKDSSFDAAQIWNRVHAVFSLSKDFGLLGFRVDAIYSDNDEVIASGLCNVLEQSQHLLAT